MTLRICDALFAMPSVRKSVTDVCEVPLVVRLVFEKFNPHVGYCHRKTIIKSNAAFSEGMQRRGIPDTSSAIVMHSG